LCAATVEPASAAVVQILDVTPILPQVCIIGAGKMSRLLVKHMQSKGCTSVTVLNRSLPRAQALAEEFPEVQFDIRLMGDLMKVREVLINLSSNGVSLGCYGRMLQRQGFGTLGTAAVPSQGCACYAARGVWMLACCLGTFLSIAAHVRVICSCPCSTRPAVPPGLCPCSAWRRAT
jgi:hypothetical protein